MAATVLYPVSRTNLLVWLRVEKINCRRSEVTKGAKSFPHPITAFCRALKKTNVDIMSTQTTTLLKVYLPGYDV